MQEIKETFSLTGLLKGSCLDVFDKPRFFVAASLINFVLLLAGVYCWSTLLFIPVALAGYILWGTFFRFYFDRRPYFSLAPLFQSLVPSTKILVLSLSVVFVLMCVPFLPPFVGLSPEYADAYSQFLQRYMEETDVVDAGLNLVFSLISPYIFYRPFLAWIAALLGRAGKLSTALNRTKGSYGQFVLLNILFLGIFYLIHNIFGRSSYKEIELIFEAPLIVYFNIVLARCYAFFFLKA